MARLSDRRKETFCREYVTNGFNASKAARSVGFSRVSAGEMGSRWLKRVDVINRVDELVEDWYGQIEMTAEEIRTEVEHLARFDPRAVYDDEGNIIHPREMDKTTAMGLQEIETINGRVVRVKVARDKKGALDMLSRMKNLYGEHQKSGAGTVNLILDEKDAQA